MTRLAAVTLCLCACAKRPVADPGLPVSATHSAPAGAFVLTDCMEKLDGDDGGVGPMYLVDGATGTVTRWVPDELPPGAEIKSSRSTSALYFDAAVKLWSLTPDGKVHLLDENPGHDESRFIGDGTHRMVVIDKSLQWRALDGKIERTFALTDFPHHVFPAPGGDRALAQTSEATVLIDERGATTLLDRQSLIDAAWSPDGKQVAFVTVPLANGATPIDDRTLLWRSKLDGAAPQQLSLPARPGPDLISRMFDLPQKATAVEGLVWASDGLVIMSNHESECWSGGRDIQGGCFWALYRLAPEGGEPKRISPRAFRCQALYQLSAR